MLWKILLAAYPQMISGYDAERIIKSANIYQNYSKNKSGTVFLLTVYIPPVIVPHYGDHEKYSCLEQCCEWSTLC